MEITEIPFNSHIEIHKAKEIKDTLELAFREEMKNHIGTFHASAQFSLAEACSGFALQNRFADLANTVMPLLRKTETKYKQPATSNISAKATIPEDVEEAFRQKIDKKGRATIVVHVEVTDANETVTMVGNYEWFVQKIK